MRLINTIKIGFISLLIIISTNVFADTNNTINDTMITAKIKSQILMDKSISIFKVGVNTNNGIVSLSGTVDSDSQAARLIELSQATDGVKDVNATELKIKKSEHPFNDVLITAKVIGKFVQEKIISDKEIALSDVHVETNNGVVYLTGTVKTQKEADNAVAIAKSVAGVKTVESSIKITNTTT